LWSPLFVWPGIYGPRMDPLNPGLYELLITDDLAAQMQMVDPVFRVTKPLAVADAPDRLALHLQQQVAVALEGLPESQRLERGVSISRALIDRLTELLADTGAEAPVTPGEVLHAVLSRRLDGSPRSISEPLIPLLDSTLLTNAPGEPNLWNQLRSEIDSATTVDVVMAFIRRSGIRPLLEVLRRHCAEGRSLRVLTTTYTGSTERAALDLLVDAGAEVKVSYDISGTRLHAKSWIFHRGAGPATAYIGSSNLTHSAQVTGLEWNVRLSAARNAPVLEKVVAVFDSYWQGGDFVPYVPEEFDEAQRRAGHAGADPELHLSPLDVHLWPYQERLLEQLEVASGKDRHRNLLVAATGTGKTVMAAVDYARLRPKLPRARLLFIAHRQEILDQARRTFRHVLRDGSFGEKWVCGQRPQHFEHVFASVQSLSQQTIDDMDVDHFDIVIIDEFHHSAAPSYDRILKRLSPRELLGLTATPERSDGVPILHWFDDHIAAELRLWDAIDQQHLAPFMYFGIHDQTDLTDVSWTRGKGYDVDALTGVYMAAQGWIEQIMARLGDHADIESMRCLAFCVGVEHARFVAEQFTALGLPAVAVSGGTPQADREAALQRLTTGEIKVVCSVDVFSEGVDVPNVDTILMLRPTESPVLFLQQLGRGLRKSPDKPHCTVLDFVGTHRKEFRYDRRFRALLGGTRRDLERSVQDGFPFLPAGCSLQLDKVAAEVVLRSVREAIPSRWPAKVLELQSLAKTRPNPKLSDFLAESGLELEDIYDGSRGWSDLRSAAGVPVLPSGPHEGALRKAVGRLLHLDDGARLEYYLRILQQDTPPDVASLSLPERRLLHMLTAQLTGQVLSTKDSVQSSVDMLWAHVQVRSELTEVAPLLHTRVGHIHHDLTLQPEVPLKVHARYTRTEILAGMGIATGAKVAAWQTGVYEAKDARAELLAFTLDKSSGGFSPTTRYRDYALSPSLIHWESQGVTREVGRPGSATSTTRRTADPSFSLAVCARMSGPSGSWARPPTADTWARSRWRSRGSCTTTCLATCMPPWRPWRRSQCKIRVWRGWVSDDRGVSKPAAPGRKPSGRPAPARAKSEP
jgi:superfamily II DNA or RNA helicase/HKD family nuclease